MIIRMLKNDLKRNKILTVTLSMFIVLAAMLVSSSAKIILTLSGSMDLLLESSNAAHFGQLHTGSIEQADLDAFTAQHRELIKAEQTVELLGIRGANIYIGNLGTSEAASVMENSFVRQNKQFDHLVDMDNQIIQLSDGEIAVPIYHMQKYNLQLGDPVRIEDGDFQKDFTIKAFLRDSLMNPSIITSKRFLVSDTDWEVLRNQLGEMEYLIEFQLYDTSRVTELETLYHDSGLPQKGTAMGYSLVKVINGMSDGIAASVIILVALLIILIAALCLRFTMLTTIEEDYREIGVMKAIGISNSDIRTLYMTKYTFLAAAACLLGALLSTLLGTVFTANITLYMGAAQPSLWMDTVPVISTCFVFGAIEFFCMVVLRRFRQITALEALRSGMMSGIHKQLRKSSLSSSPVGDVNLFLGIKEVLGRFPVYGLLCVVFILCAFLMIVPLNLLNTLESPGFVAYMGAGLCDLRIDLQQTKDIGARYSETEKYLQNDPDVQKFSALYTSSFKAENTAGEFDNLKVEVGDFSIFPLKYAEGSVPKNENEIALSVMNAEEYQKRPGDSMTLLVGEEERRLTVSGIYQDVTNGGKTAKAVIPFDKNQVIRFTVNIDLQPGVSMEEKQLEYREAFQPAKVTDVKEYIYQTFGGIIDQLRLVALFSFVLAITISVLITAMFFKLLMTKEARQTAIMKSMGFTVKNISKQYITRAILVLAVGVLLGVWAAGLIGEGLAGMLLFGISDMEFAVKPLTVYLLYPSALVAAVTATILLSSHTIRSIPVMRAAE